MKSVHPTTRFLVIAGAAVLAYASVLFLVIVGKLSASEYMILISGGLMGLGIIKGSPGEAGAKGVASVAGALDSASADPPAPALDKPAAASKAAAPKSSKGSKSNA